MAREDAEAKGRRWQALREQLSRLRSSCGTPTGTLKALKQRGWCARSYTSIYVGFDGDGTKITRKRYHSSPYRDNGRRRSDDHRRTGNSKDNAVAFEAPVQLDCKKDIIEPTRQGEYH